jgi:GH15 family glucan-1,4-alpha-glucosidase
MSCSPRLPRIDGYAPIRDYALIGDGRTAALVARDGSIDWLCLPDLDSPSVFAALLDAEHGGAFRLAPIEPYQVDRRYLPGTNVLETTLRTAGGAVRITDAMSLPDSGPTSAREIARRIEGLTGSVRLAWRVEPRFGYGTWRTRVTQRDGVAIAGARADTLALLAWDAGTPRCAAGAIAGVFECHAGTRALLALVAAHGRPLVMPRREQVETRLDATVAYWAAWSASLRYAGAWKGAVVRSALALKLLIYAPSGAIAAAATTSLPEHIGGERNWDYRYCWLRDSSFTLDALLQLGCLHETHAFFSWFTRATRSAAPSPAVVYGLDGRTRLPERMLPLSGYRDSRPVRTGNAAARQVQLGIYGDVLDTAWRYATAGGRIGRDTGRELAAIADRVATIWATPDRGIWEVRSAPRHFTHSKAMCWVALDRAVRLAHAGHIPARHRGRWEVQARAIRAFVDARCWSDRVGSYVRAGDDEDLDASLLLLAIMRYHRPAEPRMAATIEAVRRALGEGPFLRRYTAADGLAGREGAFLCCSFWLAHALALAGRRDDAVALMDTLVGLANDVGLYAEELDPATGDFLGNFPQALVHLALIGAAGALGVKHGS